MDPCSLADVHVGDKVVIKTNDQQEETGYVEEILTKVNYHHFGIKVRLENKTVGRIIKIHPHHDEMETIKEHE